MNIQSGVTLKHVFEDEEIHKKIAQIKQQEVAKLKRNKTKRNQSKSKSFQKDDEQEEEVLKKDQGREIVDMTLVWNDDVQ